MPDPTPAMEEVREMVARFDDRFTRGLIEMESFAEYSANILRLIAQPDFEEQVKGYVREALAYHGIRSDLSEAAIERSATSVSDFLARSAVGGSDV